MLRAVYEGDGVGGGCDGRCLVCGMWQAKRCSVTIINNNGDDGMVFLLVLQEGLSFLDGFLP